MNTPVALIIFNRPETTRRVFAEIRRVRPPKLFIIADGPRSNLPGDADKVAATRSIVEEVDWNCQVLKNYSDINLGCKNRVSSGIDWVFSVVERAILLEDDCLPHPTFFRYCEELLDEYAADDTVMHISGNNFQFGYEFGEGSYYYSRYPHVWGWATWRRAWERYDVGMRKWSDPEIREALLGKFNTQAEKRFWSTMWNGVQDGEIDTWDFQWVFACMSHNAFSIVPNVNLVSNIGFGKNSTHTNRTSLVGAMDTHAMDFPLVRPPDFRVSIDADANVGRLFFRLGLIKYFYRKISLFVRRLRQDWIKI
jgi:hypothetical protein